MATTRLLRQSMVPFDQLPSSSSSFVSSSFMKCLRCQNTAGLGGDKKISSADLKRSERKVVVAMKASMVTTNRLTISKPVLVPQGLSELLAEIIASVRNAMLVILLRNAVIKRKVKSSLHPQMLIERVLHLYNISFFFFSLSLR